MVVLHGVCDKTRHSIFLREHSDRLKKRKREAIKPSRLKVREDKKENSDNEKEKLFGFNKRLNFISRYLEKRDPKVLA